jgi:methylmalonyl-CoA mutase C-terminal domain/subunit
MSAPADATADPADATADPADATADPADATADPADATADPTLERGRRYRVLVAKVGLDGHDRGVKVVGRILRDAGFEVIYTGLQQTPEMVIAAARDEDVDVIGLSLLSGAHMTLVPRLLEGLKSLHLEIPVVVGGIIPAADGAALQRAGVAAVLTPGASSVEIVAAVTDAIENNLNEAMTRPGG